MGAELDSTQVPSQTQTPSAEPAAEPTPIAQAASEQGIDTETVSAEIGSELFAEKSRDYNRDAQGKFAPKDAPDKDKGASTVTPGADNTVKEKVQPDPTKPAPASAPAPAPADTPGLQAPKTWTKDALPFWGQIPPRAQAEILKRENDIHKGLQQYKDAAQVGHTFAETLRPFIPALQKFQLNPNETIKRALTAHFNLTLSSPEVKVKLARGLLQDYGIDLETLLDDLPAPGAEPSPEVLALRQQVTTMAQTLEGIQQRYQEQTRNAIATDVNTFADDPANIYFDELADDIEQLLKTGAATDLKTAYEKALWLNPVTREKELARQAAARAPKPDATQKLDAAKKAAAVNVRTQAHPASAGSPSSVGTMDDTLIETLAKIKARS